MQATTLPRPPASRLAPFVAWAGALACAAGVVLHRFWREVPTNRLADSLMLMALVALAAWPLRRWAGRSWAGAIGAVWLVLAIAMTGPLPFAAALLVACAAAALGSLVAPRQPMLALACGFAMLAGTLGWLLPLPVHLPWTYLALALGALVLRRAAVRDLAAQARAAWQDAVAAHPAAAAWALMLLGVASAATWLPTMQYDDTAYHLGLPWSLMLHGRYLPDASQQVWSYAPWAGDILQALPQVIARTEARGAVNFAWLALTAAGLWRLAGLVGVPRAWRWGVPALYATLPPTAVLLGGMQTETAGAAITVWLAVVVLDRDAGAHRFACGALLFGLLCALKPIHAVAAAPLLAWAGVRHPEALRRPVRIAGALLLVLAVGGSSYLYAWWRTGNPVLPLLNDVFHSPYYAWTSFNDARWHQGLGPALPWRMTFRTSEYVEGWNGAIGLALVALSGAWLLGFASRATRGLAVCATLAIALPLLPMQYARYCHPGIVLLLPVLVAALQRWLRPRPAAGLIAAVCIAGLALQANAGWMLHAGAVKHSLLDLGRDRPMFERFSPQRALAESIRAHASDTGPVLLLSDPFHAEFAGRGRAVDWYAPRMREAARLANRDPSGAGWASLLRREHIAEVILRPATLKPAQAAGLARVGAQRTLVAGDAEWWRIPPAEETR
ncbi:MAG: hypothetical protein ACTHOC_06795 [Luteimonas sp.]